MKKIVFVLGSLGRGGAERVISILSRDYAEKGWETSICLLLSNRVDYSIHESTKICDFSGGNGSRLKKLPYWLKSIRSYVKKEKPDVVVSFAARINVIVQIACLGLNQRIILSERNDPQYDGRGFITKSLTNILYPHASAIVFQTNRVKKQFGKKIQKKGVVIPNPIDVSVHTENTNIDKIVSVGRLTTQKNQKMLINAFADLLKVFPSKELWIYGDGELRKELEQQITSLGIEGKVHLPGNIPDIHEQIKDAALFVLSSDYEGLSNALLEAIVMGLPCISTNCAGADEYIIDHKNGLLVQVGDENGLSNAMIELFENNALREKCAQNAQQINDKITKHHVLELWHEAIDK